tara:strand:+ start:3715 stop:4446 length:732 start_codon:yes stop_codon:yes gene_type:complete
MKNVIAIIPSRSGSKGVPDKNIKNILGRPLMAYSIKAALHSKLIDRVIVSTDSPEYAEIAINYGAEVPFLRPKEISQDDSTDLDFFKHAIEWMRINEGYIPEYFVHLRPTTPMRDPIIIDNAIDKLKNSDFTSLRSVHKMSESAYKAFEIEDDILSRIFGQGNDLDESNFSRQSYPTTYDANGYVDVVRSKLIMENNLLHGNRVLPFLTESTNEIDEKGDIDKVRYLLERNILNINKLFLKDD